MIRLIRLFRTSIGSKLMIALSGSVLVLFVFGHMVGNLTIYQGQNSINAYAHWLQGHPLLWLIRLIMLSILLFHITVGVRLWWENRTARPQRYSVRKPLRSGFAERNMLLSGMIIFVFLLYHLAHLTLGWTHPEYLSLFDSQGRPDVYARLVLGFQNIWISAIYLIGLALLWLHLQHAVHSIFQTLGLIHDNFRTAIEIGALGISSVIVLGLGSIPVAVQLGFITLGGAA